MIYDHTLKSEVLRTEPLAIEEHFLVCAARDGRAVRKTMQLAEVSNLPLALPSREHGLRIAVEQCMQTIGCIPTIHTELESIVGLKQLAQQGAAYTILPRGEMEAELAAGRLKAVRIVAPSVFRTLFIAWSNERPNTPQMRAVLGVVKQETEKLIKAGAWGSRFLG